ncbi:hypothetical protein [Aeromicrobium sp. CTD01-1L150]|uniref:hypothetical protein n=1 Tax=Aeromicrobium sp. CTD01-1L150 TaxID=3341830 RepID=UPI0035C205A0
MQRDRATLVTAGALTVFGAFQTALAAGAPWGRLAYGGQREGPLPAGLRRTSAGAAVAFGVGAGLLVRETRRPRVRRRALTGLCGAMAVGTVMNGISRSPAERVWSPLCAVSAVAAWRARPPAD